MNKLNEYEKYIIAACNLYGMISINKISSIYQNHNNDVFDFDKVSNEVIQAWFISNIDGYYISQALEDDYSEHLKIVGSKPYYIPTKEEFLEHIDDGYFEDNPYIDEFRKYVNTLTDSNVKRENTISSTLFQFMLSSRIQFVLDDIIDILDLVFDSEEEALVMYDHLVKLQNNSRMWDNNGYTPIELGKIRTNSYKIGRNDPCPCGSGKKYKKCCFLKIN